MGIRCTLKMKRPTKNGKDTPDKESISTIDAPPALSLRRKGLVRYVPATNTAASLQNQAHFGFNDDDTTQVSTGPQTVEHQDEDMVSPRAAQARNSTALEEAVLACMPPGAYQVAGRSPLSAATTDYLDPLQAMVEEERLAGNTGSSINIEHEDQHPSAQASNIVSAYRVDEEEPAIIATPFKDNKIRVLIYGVLITTAVIGLIVGLSFGLTTKSTSNEEQISDSLGRLASSLNVTADLENVYVRANRYIGTENGKEISSTIGSAVVNYCEVLPCNEGGCDRFYEKDYKPGCCLGDDCDPSDKCGAWCPDRADLCYPSSMGCKEPSCYECERGPNGEELYIYRTAVSNVKCLKTGVAIGFNDKNDTVERFYKWAIGCGVVLRGGNELHNLAAGEYFCAAARIGDGITKTVSQIVPCQIIQLMECGCAPDDVQTLGLPLPPPDKPCKTKQDCPYLCGDAGEEEAKSLCDAFPGIEWWEGENPLYEPFFTKPEDTFLFVYSNVTVQIDIYGE